MISVILYGRNDSHGYNLHKRAAISLNCIGEVLTHASDEILFVDYNTPNDLPTFVEAIYDTLTARTKSLLRVLRVRPEVHAACLGGRTHLLALEPHSRNIAIRRANPQNRWVLSTNTDMVFVPKPGFGSLSDIVCELVDGHYILPRFELPEPLWEGFDRSNPQAIIRACDEFGRRLHLHEVTITHPYMRYDSPGDFQLLLRQALFDIHGFDERMIHGWHADSNMCKRFYVFYGNQTGSLADRLKGYHCDHTRVATLAHRLDIKLENDLQEFVFGLEDPYASHQADTWGMPGVEIEEVDFADGPQARFVDAVAHAVGAPQEFDYFSNAMDVRAFVFYQPEHAIPFVAGNLTIYSRQARFAYVGANPRTLEMTARVIAGMGFRHQLAYLSALLDGASFALDAVTPIGLDDGADVVTAGLVSEYDVLIFDFGLDRSPETARVDVPRVTDWPRGLRYKLGAVAQWLETCVDAAEKARRGPDVLLLNANHYVFSEFVSQFVIAAETPYNTHVRRGRLRTGADRLYRSARWKYTEELLRSYFGYQQDGVQPPTIRAGAVIDLTACGSSAGAKDGHWGAMDMTGTWTDGARADLILAPAADIDGDLIAFVRVVDAFLGPDDEPIRFNACLDGVRIANWKASTRCVTVNYRLVLPFDMLRSKAVCRLSFEIENPQSAQRMAKLAGRQVIGEDPRELGVRIQQVSFCGRERLAYQPDTVLDFTERGAGGFHLDESWTQPDCYGAWTLGREAGFALYMNPGPRDDARVVFSITEVAVNAENASLDVDVLFNGCPVGAWKLGPSRWGAEQQLVVPARLMENVSPLTVSFHVHTPRTPVQLKWSHADHRPLGFRLTGFRIEGLEGGMAPEASAS
jgi:hypothetical protein